jgi:hypothetical protein
MEQAPKARDLEQEKDRGEVPLAAKAVRVAAGEGVWGQVRVDSASAQTAVNEQPINWELPVMSKNVLSVERP